MTTLKSKVIIIKGPPGVGKSYTAKKIAARFKGGRIAIISIDELLHFDQRAFSKEKLSLALKNASEVVSNFICSHYLVIIEYTFDAPNDLRYMINKIKNTRALISIVHLIASFKEVKRRNKNRKDNSDPLPLNKLKKLYKYSESSAGLIKNERIINTDQISVNKVVDLILRELNDYRSARS